MHTGAPDGWYDPIMSIADQTLGEFLESVAAKSPTPGGGAVAAAVGALSAALAGMVVAYSVGKKALAEHHPKLTEAAAVLTRARGLMLELVEEDERAYGAVNELLKLPEGDARRTEELPQAAAAATQAPLAVMAAGCDLLRLFVRLAPITNRQLRSDLGIAAVLAEATVRSGRWNVLVNVPLLRQLGLNAEAETGALELVSAAQRLAREVEAACS